MLYSPEFRRLANVTQVLSPENQKVVHNRLTHTLEVAQIARAVVETISGFHKPEPDLVEFAGGLDPDVVEAASLVHDIGHPPFGHITESTLNDILHDHLGPEHGFDGNAQSFRIVTRLACHSEEYPGLDLTAATLSAILKYPYPEKDGGTLHKKWGVFYEDREAFEFSRSHIDASWRDQIDGDGKRLRTLEAEIMDYADDVAYAIHDMEDFYKEHLIPIDRLASDETERERFSVFHLGRNRKYRDIDKVTVARVFYDSPMVTKRFDQSRSARLDLRAFSTSMISRFVVSPKVVTNSDDPRGWSL